MNRLHLSRTLMAGTILLIVVFQCYWLKRLYKDEYNALQRRTDILLKETVQQMLADRVKEIPFFHRPDEIDNIAFFERKGGNDTGRVHHKAMITARAAAGVKIWMGRTHDGDSPAVAGDFHFHENEDYPPPPMRTIPFFARAMDSLRNVYRNPKDSLKAQRLIIQLDQLNDSIPLAKLDSQYNKVLHKEGVLLPFHLQVAALPNRRAGMDSVPVKNKLATRFAIAGFDVPVGYYAVFEQPFLYISKKLLVPCCVSLLLIGFTIVSFGFIYRNLLMQRRLADMKNEFISNITHELKTPVATVHVAIEALRNFNALEDKARTKEYLDISAIELQRLSLLIDKVLRLSMFESHKVVLQVDRINFIEMVQEVLASMRLQLDKSKAAVELTTAVPVIYVEADRLHITSVIYNLLDNALKYSSGHPIIGIHMEQDSHAAIFSITDNGIGIPAIYNHKIFEKFFRVPHNDRHDTKGYGLGLSYVAHIIKLHKGTVTVESEEGKGSTFIIKLPLQHGQD